MTYICIVEVIILGRCFWGCVQTHTLPREPTVVPPPTPSPGSLQWSLLPLPPQGAYSGPSSHSLPREPTVVPPPTPSPGSLQWSLLPLPPQGAYSGPSSHSLPREPTVVPPPTPSPCWICHWLSILDVVCVCVCVCVCIRRGIGPGDEAKVMVHHMPLGLAPTCVGVCNTCGLFLIWDVDSSLWNDSICTVTAPPPPTHTPHLS